MGHNLRSVCGGGTLALIIEPWMSLGGNILYAIKDLKEFFLNVCVKQRSQAFDERTTLTRHGRHL